MLQWWGTWTSLGFSSAPPAEPPVCVVLSVCDSVCWALVRKITVTCLAASSLMRPGFSWINRHTLRPGVSIHFWGDMNISFLQPRCQRNSLQTCAQAAENAGYTSHLVRGVSGGVAEGGGCCVRGGVRNIRGHLLLTCPRRHTQTHTHAHALCIRGTSLNDYCKIKINNNI